MGIRHGKVRIKDWRRGIGRGRIDAGMGLNGPGRGGPSGIRGLTAT